MTAPLKFALATVLLGTSMGLLCMVDWRAALGVFLFGWFLNLDNYFRRREP